ncbi:MAG: DUF3179 domain-containing protein, partial [Thermomicrobiales bacterium]
MTQQHWTNRNPDHSELQKEPKKSVLSRRRLIGGAMVVAGVGASYPLWTGDSPSNIVEAQGTPETLDSTLRFSTSGWNTDFTKHSVPLSEIRSGGPPRDGIPPIDEPAYVSIADADQWLQPLEPVIAIEHSGNAGSQARAYPLQIMVWHEIVNDMLADEPVLVTFCPLCNTAIAFDRRLPGDPTIYDFGTTGNLRFSDLVMWDRQTESWWQQITGEAIVGELTGQVLVQIPAQILGWEAFKEAYPDGNVLSRETGFSRQYGSNPYAGYDDVNSSPFLFEGDQDGRLAPMERVVGFVLDDLSFAYPLPVPPKEKAVNQRAGERDIVLFFAPGSQSALDAADIIESRDVGQVGVFDRVIDGQVLSFRNAGDGQFQDEETGTTWNVVGAGVAGELEGRTLGSLAHTVVFWFAWAAAYPYTQLRLH